MKVLASRAGIDNRQQYKLYKPLNPVSVKDVADGTVITVTMWMEYEDTNSDGETVTILSIYDDSAEKTYQTNSATFRREFADMVQILGDEGLQIVKKSGVTKADRPFVTCVLA